MQIIRILKLLKSGFKQQFSYLLSQNGPFGYARIINVGQCIALYGTATPAIPRSYKVKTLKVLLHHHLLWLCQLSLAQFNMDIDLTESLISLIR